MILLYNFSVYFCWRRYGLVCIEFGYDSFILLHQLYNYRLVSYTCTCTCTCIFTCTCTYIIMHNNSHLRVHITCVKIIPFCKHASHKHVIHFDIYNSCFSKGAHICIHVHVHTECACTHTCIHIHTLLLF